MQDVESQGQPEVAVPKRLARGRQSMIAGAVSRRGVRARRRSRSRGRARPSRRSSGSPPHVRPLRRSEFPAVSTWSLPLPCPAKIQGPTARPRVSSQCGTACRTGSARAADVCVTIVFGPGRRCHETIAARRRGVAITFPHRPMGWVDNASPLGRCSAPLGMSSRRRASSAAVAVSGRSSTPAPPCPSRVDHQSAWVQHVVTLGAFGAVHVGHLGQGRLLAEVVTIIAGTYA